MNILIHDINGEYDEKLIVNGCGGSETWTIKLSDALSMLGHDVYVATNCKEYHTTNTGVHYLVLSNLFTTELPKFDIVVFSRVVTDFGMRFAISQQAKIYIMVHDVCITYYDSNTNNYYLLDGKYKDILSHVDRIMALSDFHRDLLITKYRIPKEKIYLTKNGLDFNEFLDIDLDKERDKSILFSSRPERGLDLIYNNLFNKIREQIPEFKLYYCTYVDEYKPWINDENVINLGKLPKRQLYEEMARHRVWFYPGTYDETFCITAIENISCGVEVVSPMTYGLSTTLDFMYDERMNNKFNNYSFGLAVNEATKLIVSRINHYYDEDRVRKRKERIDLVRKNYNWINIANKFIY